MKKYSRILAAALAVIAIATGAGAAAQQAVGGVTKVNYQFEMEGKNIQVPSNLMVLSKDNSTYVPLRFLSETMGATVGFNQGRITIDGIGKVNNEISTDAEKISNLQKQVDLLKKENADLQKHLGSVSSSQNYKTLPAVVESGMGVKIRIISVFKSSNGIVLNVEFTNPTDNVVFTIDPFKTKLLVDGKSYTASIRTDATLNSPLFKNDMRQGSIVIEGLDSPKIRGIATFDIGYNGQNYEKADIAFDATK